MKQIYDVVVIGGGINGCACAADAALRGLSVLLCEKDDIASKTSSSSTKLIHGGLRYLELYDFKLVKQALDERQLLLQIAPHLVQPMPFFLPFVKTMRSVFMLRMGLFLYDHISRKNALPSSKLLHRKPNSPYFNSLKDVFKKGFLYYDCTADDARLTLENAIQAEKHGAKILPNTELTHAEAINNEWHLTLKPKNDEALHIKALSVINAGGPWVEPINKLLSVPMEYDMALVKGSHLVIPKLYEGNFSYLLQHPDRRVVFITPYHGFSMIGTTDVNFIGKPEDVCIDDTEKTYLLELVNSYLKKEIGKNDIINSWSGIRPLLAEKGKKLNQISRDYAYYFSKAPAPVLTIYSGKITTYRQLASYAIDQLKTIFPNLSSSTTSCVPLPGAVTQHLSFESYKAQVFQTYKWLDQSILSRYLNTYGTRTDEILLNCQSLSDLGAYFSNGLYQREIDFLLTTEWAKTADDILWRRTKLGLTTSSEEKNKLTHYIERYF